VKRTRLVRPRRNYAGHAGVGDELAHVFVGVNDNAEIHAVYSGIAVGDMNFALEISGLDGEMCLLYSFERAFEPVNDIGLCCDRFVKTFFQVGRHLGTGYAQQIKIGHGDVHVNFACGAHARRRTPGESFFGSGLCKRDELL